MTGSRSFPELRKHRLHVGLALFDLVGNVPGIGEDLNGQGLRLLDGGRCRVGRRRSGAPGEDAAQHEPDKEVSRLHVMPSTDANPA